MCTLLRYFARLSRNDYDWFSGKVITVTIVDYVDQDQNEDENI
jgi:hypothetical protein